MEGQCDAQFFFFRWSRYKGVVTKAVDAQPQGMSSTLLPFLPNCPLSLHLSSIDFVPWPCCALPYLSVLAPSTLIFFQHSRTMLALVRRSQFYLYFKIQICARPSAQFWCQVYLLSVVGCTKVKKTLPLDRSPWHFCLPCWPCHQPCLPHITSCPDYHPGFHLVLQVLISPPLIQNATATNLPNICTLTWPQNPFLPTRTCLPFQFHLPHFPPGSLYSRNTWSFLVSRTLSLTPP